MNHDDSLLPQHRKLVEDSAISQDVVEARGYRSVTTRAELSRLGFSESQRRVPALLIPIWNVCGEIANYQIRPDEPRVNDRGKSVNYETPGKSQMVLDVPPAARQWIGDPGKPLFVTEGVRKADSAVSRGLCCVDVLGVWNWRGTNDQGGKTALPDWESVTLNDRQVYVCFDSDVMLKQTVHKAMERLAGFLKQRGANVAFIYLPSAEDGSKVGLDDYLAAGHGVDDLMKLASSQLLQPTGTDQENGDTQYAITPAGIVWNKRNVDGTTPIPLTNFEARINAQVTEDDGAEVRRLFEIEAVVDSEHRSFTIPAAGFSGLGWVTEHLGASAIVFPGFSIKDHTRVAIQLLSGKVPTRIVFAHTGWREVNGEWVYLHAGGAIGAGGRVELVEVHLPNALMGYTLPDPPDLGDLRDAIRESLRILDLVPDDVSIPLYAGIWTSCIAHTDLSLHIAGPTGTGKTQLAALVQQHWGAGLDAHHLPGSWSGTANALEAIAFAAKDTILVVDDFAPTGSTVDVARIHREAERLFRAQGNRSGRQRMRADASIRPTKPPRGLILSTGEDIPRGQSVRARMVVLELEPDALNWNLLSECQKRAASGAYAAAMSGFIRWLAPRYEGIRSRLKSEIEELRDSLSRSSAHRRVPDNIAKLAVGFSVFLEYGVESNAVNSDESNALWNRALTAFLTIAESQSLHQVASEPTTRFVELLCAEIAAGRAHLAGPLGQEPDDPQTWGWRMRTREDSAIEWMPLGQRIGWVDGDSVYLEPEASYATAQRLARDTGDAIPVASRTLHKRLRERGLLVSTEEGRGTATVRKVLQGSRRSVLHLRANHLMPTETAQTDQPAQSDGPHEEEGQLDGQFPGQLSGSDGSETDHENCPRQGLGSSDEGAVVSLVSCLAQETQIPSRDCGTLEHSGDDGSPDDISDLFVPCSECGRGATLVLCDDSETPSANPGGEWYRFECGCGDQGFIKRQDYEQWKRRGGRQYVRGNGANARR